MAHAARRAGRADRLRVAAQPPGYVLATALFFPPVAWLLSSRSPLRDVLVGIGSRCRSSSPFTEFLGVDLPPGLTPIT